MACARKQTKAYFDYKVGFHRHLSAFVGFSGAGMPTKGLPDADKSRPRDSAQSALNPIHMSKSRARRA
jgi:hypothetical protein